MCLHIEFPRDLEIEASEVRKANIRLWLCSWLCGFFILLIWLKMNRPVSPHPVVPTAQ